MKMWSKIDCYNLANEILQKHNLADEIDLYIDKNEDPAKLGHYVFPLNKIIINHFNILKYSRRINENPEIVLETVLAHEIGHHISLAVKEEWREYECHPEGSIRDRFILENNAFVYGLKYISEEAKDYYIYNNTDNLQYWIQKNEEQIQKGS